MGNDWYTPTGLPADNSDALASLIRSELKLIGSAFDKMPALSANAGNLLQVNSQGSGLTTLPYSVVPWTPTFTFATPGNLAIVYYFQGGAVVRIGSFALAIFGIITSSFTHTTASGDVIVQGLPVSPSAVNTAFSTGSCTFSPWTKVNYTWVTPILNYAAGIRFSVCGSGQTPSTLTTAEVTSGGTLMINGSICFRTDDP